MMAMHATAMAGGQLADLRQRLPSRFGAQVLDEGDRRILVIRVPRDEPDPVNDVEAAVDHIRPEDVEDITHCVLLGNTRASQVYAGPVKDLMEERLRFDRSEADGWRARLPGTLAYQLYRSPADPRRRWRLAVRLPCTSIKDMDEMMLEELAERIGTQLEGPRFKEIVAVYLIASEDDARLEGDHFVNELLRTYKDEERRLRAAREREALAEAERRRQQREHESLVGELESRFRRDQAHKTRLEAARNEGRRAGRSGVDADLAGTSTPPASAGGPIPIASAEADITTPPRTMPSTPSRGPVPAVAEVRAHAHKAGALQNKVDQLTRRAQGVREGDTTEQAVARALNLQGFDVMMHPDTPHPIDIAAERPEGDPQRIVFRIVERLDTTVAAELLQMAKELDVDHVFCVADGADSDASRKLVATRVTWFRPDELRTLRL